MSESTLPDAATNIASARSSADESPGEAPAALSVENALVPDDDAPVIAEPRPASEAQSRISAIPIEIPASVPVEATRPSSDEDLLQAMDRHLSRIPMADETESVIWGWLRRAVRLLVSAQRFFFFPTRADAVARRSKIPRMSLIRAATA